MAQRETHLVRECIEMADTDWEVNEEQCVSCGDCVVICPVGALAMKSGLPFMADRVSCCEQSCRICEYHCQTGAIKAY